MQMDGIRGRHGRLPMYMTPCIMMVHKQNKLAEKTLTRLSQSDKTLFHGIRVF